jgi:hypothetical protein
MASKTQRIRPYMDDAILDQAVPSCPRKCRVEIFSFFLTICRSQESRLHTVIAYLPFVFSLKMFGQIIYHSTTSLFMGKYEVCHARFEVASFLRLRLSMLLLRCFAPEGR